MKEKVCCGWAGWLCRMKPACSQRLDDCWYLKRREIRLEAKREFKTLAL